MRRRRRRPHRSTLPRNASLWRRYAALGYEGLLLAAIVLLVGFLTLPAASPAGGGRHVLAVPPFPARVLSACFVFAAAGLYFTWSWTGGRRTLPMKTWRLAIVRSDGGAVDAKTAVARYARRLDRSRGLARRLRGAPTGAPGRARRVARRRRLSLAARRSGPPVPARPDRRDADRHGVGGSFICRASATPTLISTMPATASASSVSPNMSHAMTAVTAGTRKNSPATFEAAPWRRSQ